MEGFLRSLFRGCDVLGGEDSRELLSIAELLVPGCRFSDISIEAASGSGTQWREGKGRSRTMANRLPETTIKKEEYSKK